MTCQDIGLCAMICHNLFYVTPLILHMLLGVWDYKLCCSILLMAISKQKCLIMLIMITVVMKYDMLRDISHDNINFVS